ncbi:MAG: ClpXP adapter SpxH family protein [Pedobacter sp.]
MEKETIVTNPLLCDPQTGICELPVSQAGAGTETYKAEKPVKILYFTDPICSSCWGIEPQLRKLKLEYGNNIEIDYHMGGLLPDWSYNSGGIGKPADVAHHWDEVSSYYDMPIDGDVWLEDPLDSSYPPSIAFKAAQLQDKDKALLFMRELREMVFLKKKNIAKPANILLAAEHAGLNPEQLEQDMKDRGKELFEDDLRLARQFGVRGFPTMFFLNDSGERELVYGSRPYAEYEHAIEKVFPSALKTSYPTDWKSIFSVYSSLTAKEFSVLSGTSRTESEKLLDQLAESKELEKLSTKNGALWTYGVSVPSEKVGDNQ